MAIDSPGWPQVRSSWELGAGEDSLLWVEATREKVPFCTYGDGTEGHSYQSQSGSLLTWEARDPQRPFMTFTFFSQWPKSQ